MRCFVSYASLLEPKCDRCSPHYVMFPKDPKGFDVDDQYFIGASGLLVKPITTKGATETTVYLPEDEVRLRPSDTLRIS